MADQYSARPTGDSVSNVRSGFALKSAYGLALGLNKRTIASGLLLMAGIHMIVADSASSTAHNAVWPTLALGYALLFATLMIFDRCALASSQDFVDNSHAPTWSSQSDHASAQDHAPPQPRNLAALRIMHRHQTAQTPASLPPASARLNSGADWSDLMSQVSHELRTPLNAMIGFSDVMNAELLGPLENPKYREYLAHIRDSGQELLKSTEDTLAMTSLLANRPAFESLTQTSNLATTLLDAWNFVAAEAEHKSISLTLDIASCLSVKADHRPLKQTFVNLFSEAVKRTAHNGTVLVRAEQSCDIVEVNVSTQCTKPTHAKTSASLSVAIAQALLELQGTTLITGVDTTSTWSAVTFFDCPMQSDFFAETVLPAQTPDPSGGREVSA